MARMTKEEKQREKDYEAAFKKHGNCVQFNIMDLNPMHKEVLAAVQSGKTMDEAMTAAVAKYRQN